MLEYLEIQNAGPAEHLRLDLAPRLNLLTGDNGLGKSFLLDVIWWALTDYWPAQINPQINHGYPVTPRNSKKSSISYSHNSFTNDSIFDFAAQEWPNSHKNFTDDIIDPGHKRERIVIYASVDSDFAILDRSRNLQGVKSGYFGMQYDHAYPMVATHQEVWEGLRGKDNSIICDGFIRDLSNWQQKRSQSFKIFRKILKMISPSPEESFDVGKLTRVSVDDVRDTPTIKMVYGDVPINRTSAGMRRILALVYILVWTWSEHKRASEIRKLPLAREIVFLVDELDAHLHPRWQKTIVRSLMEVMKVLAPEVSVQLIAATHSPLVMASVEPFFDSSLDAWFDLDLNSATGQVEVTKRPWYRRGDADAWLKSEAFDQKSGYAPETELVLEEATTAMGNPETTQEQARTIDLKLRGLLGDMDTFWIRWGYYFEEQGWRK